jgi:ubiquitin-activating enzyme E1
MVEQANKGLSKEEMDKYSRAIGTMGLETMVKLKQLSVLIVGMRGLGFEIAKNLVLAGVKSVTIHDPTVTQICDLGANFYLNAEHVGKVTRADAVLNTFKELNPDVKVSVENGEVYTEDSAKLYRCVVITENFVNIDTITQFNNVCRKNNTNFIMTETLGAAAYAFLDFGDAHVIHDHNGEDTKAFQVANITNEECPTVTLESDVLSGGKPNSVYEDGDYVKFVEVRGMTEING